MPSAAGLTQQGSTPQSQQGTPQAGNFEAIKADLKTKEQQVQAKAIKEIAEKHDISDDQVEDDIIFMEDGSAIINFEKTQSPREDKEFYDNFVDEFDEDEAKELSRDILELIRIDRNARAKRDEQYEEGIKRSGMGKDAPGGATFPGASKVVHPVITESCVDFGANAVKELLPPDGVVKPSIMGTAVKEAIERAGRKTQFLNWQVDYQVPEYREEMETLLVQLPMGGSQFSKWIYDARLKRPKFEWIPVDKFLLPYGGAGYRSAERATEVQEVSHNTFMQRIADGIYEYDETADMGYDEETGELRMPAELPANRSLAELASDRVEGVEDPERNVDGIRTIYEVYITRVVDQDDEADGELAPYIITIDETSKQVLSIKRNWMKGDSGRLRMDWHTEWKFIPWRGAYGIGYAQLIGGLATALTGTLRALLDAAYQANSQTMVAMKGHRLQGQTKAPSPGEVLTMEMAPGVQDIRQAIMKLDFGEPSAVLFNMLSYLDGAAKGVLSTAEEKIGDNNGQNTPVGTTQALIEQGSKIFSSIHARLHRSQRDSLRILSRLNYWYLDEMSNQSGTSVHISDFSSLDDVVPVSDPNIFSDTQRVAQGQALLQLAQSAPPGMYDIREIHRRILQTLKIPNVEVVLPDPQGLKESNQALENVGMSMGRPAAAFPDQDHISHLKTHLGYAQSQLLGGSPLIGPIFAPLVLHHIKDHTTMFYLQTLKNVISQTDSAQGEDVFAINEEGSLDEIGQQAVAIASDIAIQEITKALQPFQQSIQQLAQMVQKQQQAQQEQAAMGDPQTQALLKVQQAEIQRKTQADQQKAQIDQAKLQLDQQQAQLDAQTKQAEMQQAMQELQQKAREGEMKIQEMQAKMQQEQDKHANELHKILEQIQGQIVLADKNNAAKERLEYIKAGMKMNETMVNLQAEEQLTAFEADQQVQADLRTHQIGISQQQLDAEHQARLQSQGHEETKELADQSHGHTMEQHRAGVDGQLATAHQSHVQNMAASKQQHGQGLEMEGMKQQGNMAKQKQDQNFQAANKLYDRKNAEADGKDSHKRSLEMEDKKGKNQLALAKAKPKPKPGK